MVSHFHVQLKKNASRWHLKIAVAVMLYRFYGSSLQGLGKWECIFTEDFSELGLDVTTGNNMNCRVWVMCCMLLLA
jgi:hypothetical protein